MALSYERVKAIVEANERDGFSATQVRTRCDMRAEEFVGTYGSARCIESDEECVVFSDGSKFK